MLKYIKLSLKYILKYPKRSISMILSIVLSSVLVIFTGSVWESSRVVQVNEAKKFSGVYHTIYDEINLNQIEKIKENKNIRTLASSFYYDTWNTENKLTVKMLGADEKILYMESTELESGRFPKEPNEIAIEKWVLDRLNIKHELGQTLNMNLEENGQRKFKIVGIVKNRLCKQKEGQLEAFVGFNKENLINRENHINSYVEFKDKTEYRNEANRIGKEIGIKRRNQIILNKDLLGAMGQLNAIDWELVKRSVTLMIIGGMVIYSIYGVSVLKRIQEFGIMRSIGTTNKQVVYIIFSEIGIIYIIGMILGIILGSTVLYFFKGSFTSRFVEGIYKLDIKVISSFSIILSMITNFVAIGIAAIRGVLIVNKMSPLEAINKATQDKHIKINKKESFIEKHLMISKKVAYKNLKRNKKAVIFTIISMAIGCNMFMAERFRSELFDREHSYQIDTGRLEVTDFRLDLNDKTPMKEGYTKEQIEDIKKLPQVKSVSFKQILYSKIKLNKKYMNGINGENYIKYMDNGGHPQDMGRFAFNGDDEEEILVRNIVLGLSDNDLRSLEQVLEKGSIDLKKMKNEPSAIIYIPKSNKNGRLYREPGDNKLKPVFNFDIGDKLKLTIPKKGYDKSLDNLILLNEHEKYRSQYIEKEFNIVGIIEYFPDEDISWLHSTRSPYVIISENMFKEFSGIDKYRTIRLYAKNRTSKYEYEKLRKEVQKISELIPGTELDDRYGFNVSTEKSVNTYNLIQNSTTIVLIIISGLSIFNNINYNLMSRVREHGIMKAVGLTTKQFKEMIVFEGIFYGLISSIFTVIVIFIIQLSIFIYWAYIYENPLSFKKFFINPWDYLVVIFINLFIGYIATIGPKRKVNKMEVTEAIRHVE
ncbi:ABC-type transport system, involved in lipoprotein release, permease component [Gottschalkia purinilytica]|uniref:ABC-type transport system, involved in lipoprotein release, permease component n=1 Tax=Gottschalkia purinilytica TaxID=1503 RepID=A0A0L0WC85_GOTPU|nr:ABC transporter permease [Gottschalkia purinilytica]KNF09020.1 ABC-type transport system, involved in lipoprotein release, permease component [Gottschalkia purinilytica]